ncbi:MAG TPA: thioredoxin family protein [Candidatus Dormibacteraeota bacterium]
MSAPSLPDGLVAFVKRDCPTCVMVAPVLAALKGSAPLTVFSQDDPTFPAGVDPIDDSELEHSYRQGIETVPTLFRVENGAVVDELQGWLRSRWEELTGVAPLGEGLPEYRAGCGSRSVEPGIAERLAARFDGDRLASRRVRFGAEEDEFEAAYARGWSDGLPVVPPTAERVFRMLHGTSRDPGEVVALVPPDLARCTVEKVAVNAVMAGCRPEHLPVVLAALEGACTDEFNMHGLLATTFFSGPILIVNGPIAREIGMNSAVNVLGQGNRANLTIGRALQLVVRNVGGGMPGGVDRATLGSPGKLGFCFAEREEDSPWEPLHVELGYRPEQSTVTLFAGQGPTPIVDQLSRSAESLIRSFAACLNATGHPNLALGFDAIVVVPPDHASIFRDAGWSKARMRDEVNALLTRPGRSRGRGAGGMDEGLPESLADADVPKFRAGGLHFVHAGGNAGMFSGILSSWVNPNGGGSTPVTVEVGR